MTQDRGWRFRHPDLQGDSIGIGFANSGGIAMVQHDQAVAQAILMLISTIPGERVMRPEYGCHIHQLLFAPNNATTAGLAIHYVRTALERWETRIEIIDLDADADEVNPERLNIWLHYRVIKTQHTDQLVFSFDTERRT